MGPSSFDQQALTLAETEQGGKGGRTHGDRSMPTGVQHLVSFSLTAHDLDTLTSLYRKRPFATGGQWRRQTSASVYLKPCLILCLVNVKPRDAQNERS